MARKAKTSARSKGYRKTEKKKPFLTKKEIIALVAIVAAIAVALILGSLLYDDGSLDLVDGEIQTENLESSLIVNAGSAEEPKYFKVGEVGDVAGYTRERVEGSGTTYASFRYYPEDEASPVEYLNVAPGARTPAAMAQNSYLSYIGASSVLGVAPEGIQEIEIDGRQFYYIIGTHEYHPSTVTEDGAAATDEPAAEASVEPAATEAATATPEATQAATVAPEATAAEPAETQQTGEEAASAEEEAAQPYICEQTLRAYAASELNDDYSIILSVHVSGESEPGLDEEGLAAYTEGLYLSEEELLDYLRELIPAVFPA